MFDYPDFVCPSFVAWVTKNPDFAPEFECVDSPLIDHVVSGSRFAVHVTW
jgi:hypothetical protein